MAKRKTVSVSLIKAKVNDLLSRDTLGLEEKKVLCFLLEGILMDTGNYKGYNNLYWIQKGCSEWEAAGKPDFPEKEKFIVGGMGEWSRVYF